MKILCLVGLESVGECLNKHLLEKISESKYFSKIAYLLQDLPFKSYFVTSDMHRVCELSIGALLATQIKLLGYHLEQIDHIDKPYPCICLSYKKKPTDSLREIRYYNFNLLKKPLAILEYLFEAHQFDAGFMKATSYATKDTRCILLNKFLASNLYYILQSDSGIPVHFLIKNWHIKMFGIYGVPYLKGVQNIPPNWGYQALLHSLFNQSQEHQTQKLSWQGLLPFCFDYGGVLKPKDVRCKISILMELKRH